MKQQLQDALSAMKAGDVEKARQLLAEFLREEPDYIPAWVLLSKITTSDVQKAAFLRKVLSLEPGHAYASQELARMGAAAPPQVGEPAVAVEPSPAETEADEAPQLTATPEAEVEPDAAPEHEMRESAEVEPLEAGDAPIEFEQEDEDLAAELDKDLSPAVSDMLEYEAAAATGGEQAEAEREDDIVTAELDEDLEHFSTMVKDGKARSPMAEAEVEGESIEEAWEEAPPEPGSLPVSDMPLDYDAQARGDTIPPWMSDGGAQAQAAPAAPVPTEDDVDVEEADEDEDLPAWLQEKPDASWLGEEETTQVAAEWPTDPDEEARIAQTEAKLAAAMASRRKQPAPEAQPKEAPAWLVGGLVLVAIVIFLLLVYAAANFISP